MSVGVKWQYPPSGQFTGLKRCASKGTIVVSCLVAKFCLGRQVDPIAECPLHAAISEVGNISRKPTAVVGTDKLNTFKSHNAEILTNSIHKRAEGHPLLTVSNHMSCVDDPAIFASIFRWKEIICATPRTLRWGLAAADICFTRDFHAKMCALTQSIPVVRGGTVYQRGVDFAIEKLNAGNWVHTFPEGRVRYCEEPIRLKWGVGRMIEECKKTPLVIPFYFLGIEDILPSSPQGTTKIPKIGKKTTLCVGDNMDFAELLQRMRAEKRSSEEIRKAITDLIQDEFLRLRKMTEQLHYSK